MNRDRLVKYVAVAAAALLCVGTRASAQVVISLNADDSNFFMDANGNWLAPGDLVEMGQFSVNDTTLQGLVSGNTITPANYATLVSDFVPLNVAATQYIDNDAPNSGDLAGAFSGSNSAFASGKVYIMVVNAGTTTGANQVGVFEGQLGIGASSWQYPASMVSGDLVIDTDNITAGTTLIGKFVGGTSLDNPYNDNQGNGNATLNGLELDQVIPEPSSIALVGMGLIGLLALRRRS